MQIAQPPIKDELTTRTWSRWFTDVYRLLRSLNPSVSADNGDADVTLAAGKSAMTQRFDTALTAARTVTFSTTDTFNGSKFRVVREAGATGAYDLDVGGLKTLSGASEWADVEHDGTAWRLTGYGSL